MYTAKLMSLYRYGKYLFNVILRLFSSYCITAALFYLKILHLGLDHTGINDKNCSLSIVLTATH